MFVVTIIDKNEGFIVPQDGFFNSEVWREAVTKLFNSKDDAGDYAYCEYMRFLNCTGYVRGTKTDINGNYLWWYKEYFMYDFLNETGREVIADEKGYVAFELTEVKTPEPNEMKVVTSAGVLKASRSMDAGMPGIGITLLPAGAEPVENNEIDVALAAVYEESNYVTDDKERPVDVVIHHWCGEGEDCTGKEIIRRETAKRRCGL